MLEKNTNEIDRYIHNETKQWIESVAVLITKKIPNN